MAVFGQVVDFVRWTMSLVPAMLTAGLLVGASLFVLILALIMWIRYRKKDLLPHLHTRRPDGRWPLLVGFFHPYCNAGGGGERVLWVAIKALYKRYPHVQCVVYTGDTDATSEEITARAKQRFNIVLPRPVHFVYLTKRSWVEASPYPYFTLLCQSFGSLVLGWEAMMKFIPDVYIDSMGYAFTLPLFRYVAGCPVLCYTHYPTISTDMLERVAKRTTTYNNAGFISRSPILSRGKMIYYQLFAWAYGMAGKRSEVIMVNSTWTQGHILQLWHAPARTHIVYPPCDTAEFLALPLTDKSRNRTQSIVSVAQFRPEKDHPLQLRSFHRFLQMGRRQSDIRLVLVGGCRNAGDKQRVSELRSLAEELGIAERVDFKLNVSFNELKDLMASATVGLHTMRDEHFGIGVVELMAAGTLTLAHDSAGPKLDIVRPHNGHTTGFLSDTVESYAETLDAIFKLSPEESLTIRTNARESVSRFSDEEFEKNFLEVTAETFQET